MGADAPALAARDGAARDRCSPLIADVGIGCYRIDLPSTGGDPYIDIGCCPFEIPLGELIPARLENLLPGARNIGTTQITNGSYRMPPVE